MKKFAFISILFIFLLISSGCTKKDTSTVVRLNEVTHSIFYAPQYVAMEKGFFNEEGLSIELSNGQGSDKSMTALISDSADIALLGTEAGIYVYNEGKEDYPICFAQLTQRAGNFLISRQNEVNFRWDNVRGKEILGGRIGGMPEMILEYILNKNGVIPFEDVEIIDNIQYGSTSGAFAGGQGDYTVEFEPTASTLETQGYGYVVASLGVDSGKVPYTVYMATKDYIKNNPETVQKFTNAIYKGQLWVDSHTPKEIAEVIKNHFKENTVDEIEKIVVRYKDQETWIKNPIFEEESLDLAQEILKQNGQLSSPVDYNKFINTEFAKNAVKNINK